MLAIRPVHDQAQLLRQLDRAWRSILDLDAPERWQQVPADRVADALFAGEVRRNPTFLQVALSARAGAQTVFEHLCRQIEDASLGRTRWNLIPAAAGALRQSAPHCVTDWPWSLALCQPVASLRKRAALQPHDEVDQIAILRAREAMEVRIVGIAHVHAEAGGPLLVERTQRPVPACSAAA